MPKGLFCMLIYLAVREVQDPLHKRRTMSEAAPSAHHETSGRVKSLPAQSTQPTGEGTNAGVQLSYHTNLQCLWYFVHHSMSHFSQGVHLSLCVESISSDLLGRGESPGLR